MNVKRNISALFRKQVEQKSKVQMNFLFGNIITSRGIYEGGKLKIQKI